MKALSQWTFYFYICGLFICGLSPGVVHAQSSTGTWHEASSDGLTPRIGLTASAIDSEIYVVGGVNNGHFDDVLEVFSSATNSWSIPDTHGSFLARAFHSATVFDNMIYIIGGVTSAVPGTLPRSTEVFDPSSNNWSILQTIDSCCPRWGQSAALIGSEIYVFGGDSVFSPPPAKLVSSVQVLDLVTRKWGTLTTTGVEIPPFISSCDVINGKIYFTGGADSSGKVLDLVEMFDPPDNSWHQPHTSGIFTARGGHASAVINNKIYIIGGLGKTSDLSNVEAFDPATNNWSSVSTGGQFTPRDELSSAVIDGQIFAIGGENDAGAALNTNEILSFSSSNVQLAHKDDDVSIFPDPTLGSITISGIPILSVMVTNVLGVKVAGLWNPAPVSGDEYLDLSKLPAGTYFVSITTPKGIITRKILKE